MAWSTDPDCLVARKDGHQGVLQCAQMQSFFDFVFRWDQEKYDWLGFDDVSIVYERVDFWTNGRALGNSVVDLDFDGEHVVATIELFDHPIDEIFWVFVGWEIDVLEVWFLGHLVHTGELVGQDGGKTVATAARFDQLSKTWDWPK
jgi:hypothetical protein